MELCTCTLLLSTSHEKCYFSHMFLMLTILNCCLTVGTTIVLQNPDVQWEITTF